MTSTRAPGSPTSWPASPTSRRRGCTSCCRGTGERPARTLLLPRQPDHGSTKLRVHHRPRRPNAWQGRGPPLRPRHATRTRRRSPLDLRHRRPRYTRVHRTRYREPQGAHPRSEAVSGASRPALANRVPGRMDTTDRQVEAARLAAHAEAFCQRVRQGLERADFGRKRELLELLIDRVIVTGETVEIRYAIPVGPEGEREPFCRLRTDYQIHLSAPRH